MQAAISTGLCTNPACSLAAEAVERYPGPGEYCPVCGELLAPVPTETPASSPSNAPTAGRQRSTLIAVVVVATIVVGAIAAAVIFAALRPAALGRQASAASAAFNDGAQSRRRIELIENATSCAIVLLRPACSRELDETELKFKALLTALT